MHMLVTKEFLAAGMSCNHCKAAIEASVRDLGGIASVNADPVTKKVVVKFDESTTSIDDIRHKIEEAGYTAVDVAD